jgi:predicted secreted protein
VYRAPAKMMMEAASDAVAPQVEAGTTRISIQADGTIEVLMP